MKTFHLEAKVTISLYCTVEAETEQDAIEKAKEFHIEDSDPWQEEEINDVWYSDEFDGEPFDIILSH